MREQRDARAEPKAFQREELRLVPVGNWPPRKPHNNSNCANSLQMLPQVTPSNSVLLLFTKMIPKSSWNWGLAAPLGSSRLCL